MIYSQHSYRKLLQARILSEKKRGRLSSLAEISLRTRIDKSYLTNVFHERAHFNADQMFSLATCLGFNDREIDYLQLLLEYERTQLKERKEILKTKLNSLRQEGLKTEKHLKKDKSADLQKHSKEQLNKYFSSPLYQLIHFSLAFKKYKINSDLLAKNFRITPTLLQQILKDLEDMKLIHWDSQKQHYERTGSANHHLSEDDPLCFQNQLDLRVLSHSRVRELAKNQKYIFNASFGAPKEAFIPLKELFLKYIQKAQKIAVSSDPEQLYQINFDLFPWLDM